MGNTVWGKKGCLSTVVDINKRRMADLWVGVSDPHRGFGHRRVVVGEGVFGAGGRPHHRLHSLRLHDRRWQAVQVHVGDNRNLVTRRRGGLAPLRQGVPAQGGHGSRLVLRNHDSSDRGHHVALGLQRGRSRRQVERARNDNAWGDHSSPWSDSHPIGQRTSGRGRRTVRGKEDGTRPSNRMGAGPI